MASIDPSNWVIWLDWSFIYFEQGDYKRAIETLQTAIEEAPEVSDVHYRMVVYLIYHGDYKNAFSFLENGLTLDFDNHKVLFDFFPKMETQKALFRVIRKFRKK